MTTHDRGKVIAAAREAGFEIDCCSLEWHKRAMKLYAIAYEAGRQAEREECNQDAERYRWLRNGGDDDHGVGIYDSAIEDFCFTTWNEELDYAIDEARSTK